MERCCLSVAISSFALFVSITVTSGSCPIGTKAVRWTLYQNKRMTWNEASQFCFERGGHLPVTNNDVTMAALQDTVAEWDNNNDISGDFWIGLHSNEAPTIPNIWEADCQALSTGVQHWDSAIGEPDDAVGSRCTRIHLSNRLWRTKPCSDNYCVICETDRGNCTYQSLVGVTMTQYPDASSGSITDVSTCWSLCLQLVLNGKECMAAVLESSTAVCKLYVGTELLSESAIQTASSAGSTVMLRRCFESNTVSDSGLPAFSFTDNSRIPSPARGICTSSNQGTVVDNCLPTGVEVGLVTVTTPTTTTTPEPTTTVEERTTADLVTSVPTTTEAPTTEDSPATTETAATTTVTSEETTPSEPMTTGTEATTAPETTIETETNSPLNRCPCNCQRVSQNQTAPTPPQPQELLVVRNATSSYRRKKTSVLMMQTSHVVIGTTWVLVCSSVVVMFVLCDVTRLVKWLDQRRNSQRV